MYIFYEHSRIHLVVLISISYAVLTLHKKKRSFPLRISPVNVTKTAGNYYAVLTKDNGKEILTVVLKFLESFVIPLSANPKKWSNALKQIVGNLATNCLSVFDHFVGLALKGLRKCI